MSIFSIAKLGLRLSNHQSNQIQMDYPNSTILINNLNNNI